MNDVFGETLKPTKFLHFLYDTPHRCNQSRPPHSQYTVTAACALLTAFPVSYVETKRPWKYAPDGLLSLCADFGKKADLSYYAS